MTELMMVAMRAEMTMMVSNLKTQNQTLGKKTNIFESSVDAFHSPLMKPSAVNKAFYPVGVRVVSVRHQQHVLRFHRCINRSVSVSQWSLKVLQPSITPIDLHYKRDVCKKCSQDVSN